MNKFRLLSSVSAVVFSFVTTSSHAAGLISTFSFDSMTTSCVSEISANCLDINTNGLSGTFQVDLGALDAYGKGSISWNNFINFDATNSVSSWSLANLRDGGLLFNNWMVTDFGIDAFPDYSNGWDRLADGGGELLLIRGFGVSASAPAFSNASSLPGSYCPSTGAFVNPNTAGGCPGGTVLVNTLGIQARYAVPVIQAVPIPAALCLFGSGLLGLAGIAKRKRS